VRIAGTSGGGRDLGQDQESVLLRAIYRLADHGPGCVMGPE
jgi:hypothetical protein